MTILPLRAVLFQFLFLLIAIAIEGFIFYRTLADVDYKTSMQYAITVNLLSTFLGWLTFFSAQPFLLPDWRAQLISFIFFERFYSDSWLSSVAPILVLIAFSMFMSTFFIKLGGLALLETLLEKTPPQQQEIIKSGRFRGREHQFIGWRHNSRIYSVLVANACSFSAILLLLLIRLIGQNYYF